MKSREQQQRDCNLWEEIVKLQSQGIPFLWSNIVETWLKEKLSAISNIQIRKSVSIRLPPGASNNHLGKLSSLWPFYFFPSPQQFHSRWTNSINPPPRLPLIAAFHLRSCSLKFAVPSIIKQDGLGSSDESQQKWNALMCFGEILIRGL